MRVHPFASLAVLLTACAEQQAPAPDAAPDVQPDVVLIDTGVEVLTGLADPPRPVAPLSSAMVNTRRPLFRWSLAQGTDGAVVEVCRDRNCNDRLVRFTATGASAQPDMDLPPGVLFWRLLGRRGPTPGEAFSPTWQVNIATRVARVTTSFGTILDINGDGHTDMAAGDPGASGSTGLVNVYVAANTDLPLIPTFALTAPSQTMRGFGAGLASAGDLDGDGYGDLAVGASGEMRAVVGDAGVSDAGVDAGTPDGGLDGGVADGGTRDAGRDAGDAGDAGDPTAGVVLIYRGGASGISPTPSYTLALPGGGTLFGAHIAAAGDVNGDGYGDLLVSAQGSRAAYLFLGSSTGVSISNRTALGGSDALFASAVAGPGDVNGDGFADVLVGSPGEAAGHGAVNLYLGSASGLQTSAIAVAARDANDRRFGAALAGAGDVNGDGLADVIVGAPGATAMRGGRAYVYTGTMTGLTGGVITALAPNEGDTAPEFGASVSSAGDVNSDGTNDVLVGSASDPAMATDATVGRVYVFLGSGLGVSSMVSLTLEGPAGMGARFGAAMALAGDVNGDAFGDIFVSEPRALESRGQVHVYFGGMQGLAATPAQTLTGRDPGALQGSSLAGW